MRIKTVQIKNFRSFKDCRLHLDRYTSLVGPNGVGKSTILSALNIFFREEEASPTSISELDAQDFHERDTSNPIEITVTFGDLSEEAAKDFTEYVRQGSLTITATANFDQATGRASVRQYGQRLAMTEFAKFFELYNINKPAAELRAEYGKIKKDIEELPTATTRDAMREALRFYEENNPSRCVLIPSEDQFYGFSKGANRLAKHVQWIYVPAVKDATKEVVEAKNTALGKILARTVRAKVKFDEEVNQLKDETLARYRKLLQSQQGALDEISQSLTKRLNSWAHPGATARLSWTEDPKKSVQVEEPVARLLAGEGTFEGELVRFGHGLQRSYLLALLQELASTSDADAPTLILGCEEPELYQHPPQARHLADVLEKLSRENAQIIVSTHSPYFISGRHFESLRMVHRPLGNQASTINSVEFTDIAASLAALTGSQPKKPVAQKARLQQALQPHLNEMFFAQKVVFVEGLEDLAYLTAWLILNESWDEFRRSGAHIVPANGKSYLIEPIVVAQKLKMPIFVIFDADGNVTNANQRTKHEKDNRELLELLGGDPNVPFPSATVWGGSFVQWPANLSEALRSEAGKIWDQTFSEASKGLGSPEGSFAKNPMHIGDHIEILFNKNAIPGSLTKLGAAVMQFAAT